MCTKHLGHAQPAGGSGNVLASSFVLPHCPFLSLVCGEHMGQMAWKYSPAPVALQLRHELHTYLPPIQVSLLRARRD